MKFTILQHFFTNAWLSFVSNYYCRAFDCSRFHQYCNYIGCRFSHLPHVGVKFSLFHYDVLLFKKWIRISFAKILPSLSLSVIRQKGESQNGCFKKTKHAEFSEKRTGVSGSVYQGVSGGRKCSFFGKFGVLCFVETPVLRFTLLPYYRRFALWASV